jgi:hypothetical protein
MHIFINSKDFIIINCIFIISILFTYYTYISIDKNISGNYLLKFYVNLCQVFFISLLLSIIPYYRNTLETLQPSNIILNLSNFTKNLNGLPIKPGGVNDPIQPLTDVILRSISKDDQNTAIDGLECINSLLIEIINKRTLRIDEEDEIAKLVCFHLKKIAIIELDKKRTYLSYNIIKILNNISNAAIKGDKHNTINQSLQSLEKIGNKTIETDNDELTYRLVTIIHKIGLDSIRANLKDSSLNSATSLGKIAKLISLQVDKDGFLMRICIEGLKDFLSLGIKNHMDIFVKEVLVILGVIATNLLEREKYREVNEIIICIRKTSRRLSKTDYVGDKNIKNIKKIIKTNINSIRNRALELKNNNASDKDLIELIKIIEQMYSSTQF